MNSEACGNTHKSVRSLKFFVVETRNTKTVASDAGVSGLQITAFTVDRSTLYFHPSPYKMGHAAEQLVEVLRYKPEGRGLDSRWCHCNFS